MYRDMGDVPQEQVDVFDLRGDVGVRKSGQGIARDTEKNLEVDGSVTATPIRLLGLIGVLAFFLVCRVWVDG